MPLHFSREELLARQARCRAKLVEEDLDAIPLFKQESMFYLTGFDTTGYLYFQTLLVTPAAMSLLTRSGDLASARQTSVIEDIRIWVDRAGADPARDIRDLLASHGLAGKRIGIEYQAVGLNAYRGRMLDAALDGFCTCVDASLLVDGLRLIKCEAELGYVRRSAALTHKALEVANRVSVPGASLGAVRAAMIAAVIEGGGDPPTIRWPLGCGEGALMVRYYTGSHDQRIGAQDQVTHELGASYRHYHTALMHVVLTGTVDPRQRDMLAACRAALDACEQTMRPGNTFGDIYAAHADTLTRHGFAEKSSPIAAIRSVRPTRRPGSSSPASTATTRWCCAPAWCCSCT